MFRLRRTAVFEPNEFYNHLISAIAIIITFLVIFLNYNYLKFTFFFTKSDFYEENDYSQALQILNTLKFYPARQ